MLPLLLAGGAMALGGTGMGMAGSNQARNAMNDELNRALATIRGYGTQNDQTFQASLAGSSRAAANKQMQRGREQFLAGFDSTRLPAFGRPSHSLGSAMGAVGSSAKSKMAVGKQANLAGYQNWGFEQGLKDMAAGQQFNNTNTLAQNSLAPSMAAIQDAGKSGKDLMGMGSLLTTGGQLLGLYGMVPAATPAGSVNTLSPAAASLNKWATSPQASPLYLGTMAPQPQQSILLQ